MSPTHAADPSDRDPVRPLVVGTTAAVDVRYKGQESVIQALADLKSAGVMFHYRLAGGGDPTRLHSLAKHLGVSDQVEFTGPLNHHSIFTYLDDLDLYIQPSYQEGLSRALVEALSRGLPALASHAGGNGEIVPDEYLFKPGATAQIAALLMGMTLPLMKEMATANFDRAKKFDPERLERERLAIFEEFAQLSVGGALT